MYGCCCFYCCFCFLLFCFVCLLLGFFVLFCLFVLFCFLFVLWGFFFIFFIFYLSLCVFWCVWGCCCCFLRTILIVRKQTRCHHIGYSYRLTARVLLYASSHRQDNTYHGLCYTSRGALAGTRNSSMGPPHEGSIRRPIAP